MTIVSLGVTHRNAAAEVLEKLAVPSAQRGSVLARLQAMPSIDEVAVLSTCNRVEVYASAPGSARPVAQAVADVLSVHGQVEVGQVLRMARIRIGGAAIEHLFSVACGLDSMAIGEDQIVAQIKEAARAATAAGTAGPAITALIDAALRASKRARTQTTISTEGISLVRAGLDLAQVHLAGLAARDAVVVGTGSTGKLAARLLREAGVGRLSVASRSPERAAEVAAAVHGRQLCTSDVAAALADADILVATTGATATVVLAEHVRAARAQAGRRPLFVLDLGMPPDVEPAVGELAGVTLVDIAALRRHLAGREVPSQVPEVRAIIAAEAAAYIQRQDQAIAAPVIAAMHAQKA
jgi:glutamyl-tRNA reductase